MYNKFNVVHEYGESIIVLRIPENQLRYIFSYIFSKISEINVVNKFYLLLKVKILVYLFNLIVNFIPQQKTDHLTENLQNDYMAILNKNRRNIENTVKC